MGLHSLLKLICANIKNFDGNSTSEHNGCSDLVLEIEEEINFNLTCSSSIICQHILQNNIFNFKQNPNFGYYPVYSAIR